MGRDDAHLHDTNLSHTDLQEANALQETEQY